MQVWIAATLVDWTILYASVFSVALVDFTTGKWTTIALIVLHHYAQSESFLLVPEKLRYNVCVNELNVKGRGQGCLIRNT